MTIAKPVGLVLIGVVLGMLASSSVKKVGAAQQNAATRLVFAAASSNNNAKMYFVSDTKTGGCWLASVNMNGSGDAVALVAAPDYACR